MNIESVKAAINDFFNNFITNSGITLVRALMYLMLGIVFIKVVIMLSRQVILKSKLDNSAGQFILSVEKAILVIILFILIMNCLGISTTGIIATLSACALALALALQNSLTSLTNGVIIIFTKPFKAGDHIEINGIDGVVKSIRLFNTKIISYENVEIIVPNSDILSSTMINYSSMPLRRINLVVPVSYDSDIDEVKKVLMKALTMDKNIVTIPAPLVRLNQYDSSSINFSVRGWTKNESYFDVRFDLLEEIFKALKKANIEIPYNKLDVKILNDNEDTKYNKSIETLSKNTGIKIESGVPTTKSVTKKKETK